MPEINIVHCRKELDNIYCGRGSALGSPFKLGVDGNRDIVCDLYHEYFYDTIDEVSFLELWDLVDYEDIMESHITPQMKQLYLIFNKLVNGEDVNLGCYCTPNRCHVETIKEFLELKLEELDK